MFSIPDELVYKAFDPRRPIPEEEQLDRFWGILPHLIVKAHKAMHHANSWRNFRVGCALWAFKTQAHNVEERWSVFTGANLKIATDARPVCAEQIAVGAARQSGYDRIIGLIIVGEPQSEEENSEGHPTLHPCKECRRVFKTLSEISPNTLIVTVVPKGDVYEIRTFKELLQIYGEEYRQNGSIT